MIVDFEECPERENLWRQVSWLRARDLGRLCEATRSMNTPMYFGVMSENKSLMHLGQVGVGYTGYSLVVDTVPGEVKKVLGVHN